MEELKKRSIAKAISWRTTGTIDTMIVSYFITGNVTAAVSIGLVEVITKIALYYFHERAWNKIGFGKTREPEYSI